MAVLDAPTVTSVTVGPPETLYDISGQPHVWHREVVTWRDPATGRLYGMWRWRPGPPPPER